jgi:hypothetical protein
LTEIPPDLDAAVNDLLKVTGAEDEGASGTDGCLDLLRFQSQEAKLVVPEGHAVQLRKVVHDCLADRLQVSDHQLLDVGVGRLDGKAQLLQTLSTLVNIKQPMSASSLMLKL